MEWSDGVDALKGVGPKKRAALSRLGINTLYDLVTHYPRAYIDQSAVAPLRELRAGSEATVSGVILNVSERKSARGMTVLSARIGDGGGYLSLVWFGQPFLKKKLLPGVRVLATGRVEHAYGSDGLSMSRMASFEVLDDAAASRPGALPVYPSTEALSQTELRKLIGELLSSMEPLPDEIPERVRRRYELPGRWESVVSMHFPKDMAAMRLARDRLAFEELYLIQCGLMMIKKRSREEEKGVRHLMDSRLVKKVIDSLPFRLTGEQERAWREISSDMERPAPMRRLVEGDVGSGKTALALLALVKTVENGWQGAMMAPTEILARQHFATFTRLLEGTGIRLALLSGKLAQKERKETLSAIASHEVDIAIGTHALIQDEVNYAALGLVVTDEQHRFGIAQRASLAKKGMATPDVLVMTATPIPRTMTLTVYGDLDISKIEELPPGRKPVRTFVRTGERRGLVYEFVRKEIEAGRQAYVVCPLIEDGEDESIPSAERIWAELSEGIFRGIPCGLAHGRMKPKEKDTVMDGFYEGRIKLLVATTVIEVGVDVPNASVIVVEHADRFGLAQLHQLRGRIGRGPHKSYCILLSDGKSPAARERLSAMERTTSGFELAEEDLLMRGPGEFFGSMQHGLGDLKVASVLRDTDILMKARRAAMETIESGEDAKNVRRALALRYGGRFFQINDA